MIKEYFTLTKPGIVRGNIIVATAAFLFAANGDIDWMLLINMIVGVAMVIASGCVANNFLDKDIDAKMDRTKDRSMVTGNISMRAALVFAFFLGLIGFLILFLLVNPITASIGVLGFVFYVFIYGYFKRNSIHGTLVGTIPGATPPLAGYTAVTGNIDWLGMGLFAILVFWQMPHFYAIAILRIKQYKMAELPLMPIVKGIQSTKYQILIYLGAFIFTAMLLFAFDKTGYTYFIAMLLASAWWAALSYQGLSISDKDSPKWAGKMFGRSLSVLLVFSALISFNWLLP